MTPRVTVTADLGEPLGGRTGEVVKSDPVSPYFDTLVQLDDGPQVWFRSEELDAEEAPA